uniref:RRM domain-containing protein n=1 Tax=Panagrellus redivivus TaxID=6233 RepID=A0A7E4VHZ9_PANRE
MAPASKETGPRALTVKLDYEHPPRHGPTKLDFENIVRSAYTFILGQTMPPYEIQGFDSHSRTGTIILDARDLHRGWAALSMYGKHFGDKISLTMSSVREQ